MEMLPLFLTALLAIAVGSINADACTCTEQYQPFCGIDRSTKQETTYSNKCKLQCAQRSNPRLQVKFEGVCAVPHVSGNKNRQGSLTGSASNNYRVTARPPTRYYRPTQRTLRPISRYVKPTPRPSWASQQTRYQQRPKTTISRYQTQKPSFRPYQPPKQTVNSYQPPKQTVNSYQRPKQTFPSYQQRPAPNRGSQSWVPTFGG